MCGITGFITSPQSTGEPLLNQAKRMCDSIAHRGPDGDGFWVDQNAGVALAHRRLAIVDLTPAGDQPMISSCGRFAMVYNGEVYNATEVASSLSNLKLRGTSDSEVILEAISQRGIVKSISQLVGMFAIAVWDKKLQELTLIRDRLGIKPIYWSNEGDTFLFGSELRALRQHPDCPDKLNHNAIVSYLRKGYFSAPDSIFSGVNKIEPGTILTVSADRKTRLEKYWSLEGVVENGLAYPFTGTDQQATDKLDALLQDAVSMRMISDVPIGAFLSGGVDSSTVAAMMQAASDQPIRTFSIGFDVEQYNEAHHAAKVAQHLKTEHTELYVTSNDALNVVPQLNSIYDEPFADASQIPTFLVSKLTRQHVTVALSGDGGDELFLGYNRYYQSSKYLKFLNQPQSILNIQARLADTLSSTKVQKYFPKHFKVNFPSHRLQRLATVLKAGHKFALYEQSLTMNENPTRYLKRGMENKTPDWTLASELKFNDDFAYMQFIDTMDYLPNDILTKVDRASMATSLEARVPLIDHRVVEFSWTLSEQLKTRNGSGKWILRNVLQRYVPTELIERPKMGFGVPIGQWLKGPLRDWAEDLLSEESLLQTGIFEVMPVRQIWSEHITNELDWQHKLWCILNLQAWAKNTHYTL